MIVKGEEGGVIVRVITVGEGDSEFRRRMAVGCERFREREGGRNKNTQKHLFRCSSSQRPYTFVQLNCL